MKVNRIFHSLDGECNGFGTQGIPCTFVRLQGCNLGCRWCDTKYAQVLNEGTEMPIDKVLKECWRTKITITGGEPLLQMAEVILLVESLILRNNRVTIETNGSIDIPANFLRREGCSHVVRFVVDYKLPSSGYELSMHLPLFEKLHPYDVIKFVVKDLDEFTYLQELLKNKGLHWKAQLVVSPLLRTGSDLMWARQLAHVLAENLTILPLRFSLQIHKFLELD